MIRIYGDIMLDRWIEGDCKRISPEAPVIVLKEDTFTDSIGGAGNLANNIGNINKKEEVILYGSVALDNEGMIVQDILDETNVTNKVFNDATTTTTKTRFVGQGGQQVLRWDRETPYENETPFDSLLEDIPVSYTHLTLPTTPYV